MKLKSPSERPRSRRIRRWLLRGFGAMAALFAIGVGVVLVLVHSLDGAWIKRRVRHMLLTSTGVEVDYGSVNLGLLSGIDIEGIVARTPGPFGVFAPEMARIAHVSARWSLSTLLHRRPTVSEIDIEGVTFAVVVDENGASSLDAIRREPSPPTPLSAWSRELVDDSARVRRLRVKDVTLRLVRIRHAVVWERDTLNGLSLDADADHAGEGSLAVALGSQPSPLDLRLERWREGATSKAVARLSLGVNATPADAAVSLDLRVVEQDLAPDVHVDQLAHLELQARFDAAHRQSEIELMHGNLGDGILTTEARAEVPDEGSPVVRHALGDLDVARMLQLLPAGLVPVRLARGHVHYQVDELAVDRPTSSAKVALDADVADALMATSQGSIAMPNARLSLKVQPKDQGLEVEGDASLGGLHLDAPGNRIDGDDLALTLGLQRSAADAWTGQAELRFATIERKVPSAAMARDGNVVLRLRDLAVDPRSPLTARGDITLDATVGSLESRGALRTTASALKLNAHLPLSGAAPFALEANLETTRLAASRADGKVVADTPARLELTLKDVTPDRDHPEKSRGDAQLRLAAGVFEARCDAMQKDDAVTIDVTAKAASLAGLRRLFPNNGGRVPWDKMAFELHTSGRAEHLRAEPLVHQESQLRISGAAIDETRVPAIVLDLRSDGTRIKHQVDFSAAFRSMVVNGTELGDDRCKMSLALDRSLPSLDAKFSNEGALDSELGGSFALDPADRAVTYEVAGRLGKLAPIAPLLRNVPGLAHFDFGALGLRLKSKGRVVGLFSSRHGELTFAPDPVRSAGGKGTAELDFTNFHWSEGDRAFTAPAATLRVSIHSEGERRRIESGLSAGEVEIGMGRHHLTIVGLHDQTSATWTGGLDDGTAELSQRASIKSIQQNFLSMYPIADVTSNLVARIDADGVFKIASLRIENAAGGSTLSLSGGVDLSADQRRLSLRTSLQQDLAHFSTRPERFVGRGNATVDLTVESPDFQVFHSRARLGLEGASIRLPRWAIALDDMDGEVPIVSDLAVGRRGLELLRDARFNPYAMLRFADQHPLLSHRSFLSIASVTTPMMSIAPFAANLRIEQNVFSLSQLELGVRGGSVTGNGFLDWNGDKTKLSADLHASGVQSSHGEPFDGNAALVIDMADRSIEGRADILRIGPRHLLDLLDLEDPHRANAGMNRIRSALDLGYPDRVKISFKHGFASAGVSFGGLARLVSVDDVRGIPIGPLMERVVRSFKLAEDP